MDDEKTISADFVSFANLESSGLREDSLDTVLSECLYRTICLVAYGNGNGCFEDVKPFVSIKQHHEEEWDDELEDERDIDYYVYEIVMPYARQHNERPLVGDLKIPKEYRNPFNPDDKIVRASRSIHETENYQIFTLDYEFGHKMFGYKIEDGDSEKSKRWACNVAGQLIINAHIAPTYIGIYDGKPLFEPNTGTDRLWLAFAELKQHQFPGLCAVCGKAINRKRESGGGKPQKTCKDHSDKFQNIKKQLHKKAVEVGVFDIANADICEMTARALRAIRPELNERPLMYPGTEILSYACMSMDNSDAKESAGDR